MANTIAEIDGEEEAKVAKRLAKLNQQAPANLGVIASKAAQAEFDEEKKKAREAAEETEESENASNAKEGGEKAKEDKKESDDAKKEKSIQYTDDENWTLEMPKRAL